MKWKQSFLSALVLGCIAASGCNGLAGKGSLRVINATSHASIDVTYIQSSDVKSSTLATNLAFGSASSATSFDSGSGLMRAYPVGTTNKVFEGSVPVPSGNATATSILFGSGTSISVWAENDLKVPAGNCVIQVWDAIDPSGTYDVYVLTGSETVSTALPVNAIVIDSGNRVTTNNRFFGNPDSVEFAPGTYKVTLTNAGTKSIVASTSNFTAIDGKRHYVIFTNSTGSLTNFLVQLD